MQNAIDSGAALEKFAAMVAALDGPKDFCNNVWKYLPKAKIIRPVFAKKPGYVNKMDTRGIGLSVIELKGGRATPEQKLNYATGYSEFCQPGDMVDKEHPLAIIHASNEEEYSKAAKSLQKLITVSDNAPVQSNCIIKKIS